MEATVEIVEFVTHAEELDYAHTLGYTDGVFHRGMTYQGIHPDCPECRAEYERGYADFVEQQR